ncbi:hypothetical protein KKH15_00290 [Patescibacteria group bacterium]|nr:hypothetical protein [Patescibacteria group bacterium]MBU1754965.1 hypothetical protein [Patescibacteria group bacterium]
MNSVLGILTQSINTFIVPALFTLSLVVFVWGLFQYYIEGAYNEERKEAAKVLLAYALVSFVVVSGIWYLYTYFIGGVTYDIPLP